MNYARARVNFAAAGYERGEIVRNRGKRPLQREAARAGEIAAESLVELVRTGVALLGV
jgi:hypothetical protein